MLLFQRPYRVSPVTSQALYPSKLRGHVLVKPQRGFGFVKVMRLWIPQRPLFAEGLSVCAILTSWAQPTCSFVQTASERGLFCVYWVRGMAVGSY